MEKGKYAAQSFKKDESVILDCAPPALGRYGNPGGGYLLGGRAHMCRETNHPLDGYLGLFKTNSGGGGGGVATNPSQIPKYSSVTC